MTDAGAEVVDHWLKEGTMKWIGRVQDGQRDAQHAGKMGYPLHRILGPCNYGLPLTILGGDDGVLVVEQFHQSLCTRHRGFECQHGAMTPLMPLQGMHALAHNVGAFCNRECSCTD